MVWFALLVCGTLSPSLANARPAPDPARAAAKARFDQGMAFQSAGAYDDAIREFEAAHKIAPLPQFLFNIAQCHRAKGDKQRALDSYQRFLAVMPEGDLSDEARDFIATLKLRIAVEEAEAGRRRAEEEATAAKRRAEDEARRRADEDALRKKVAVDDEARLKKIAAAMAEEQQRQRDVEQAAFHKRLAAANASGTVPRIIGAVALVAGILVAAGSILVIRDASKIGDRIDQATRNNGSGLPTASWTTQFDRDVATQDTEGKIVQAMWIGGGVLIVGGIAALVVGVRMRTVAVERAGQAPSVTVAPILDRSSAGLALGGSF